MLIAASVKNIVSRFAPVLGVVCLLQAPPSLAKPASEADLKKLKNEIHTLQKQLDKHQDQRKEVNKSLRTSEVSIGRIQKQLSQVNAKISKQTEKLKGLQQRRRRLQQSKQDQQAYLAQYMVAAYQIGNEKKLKVLLNQEHPDRLSRVLTYYDYFRAARSERIDEFLNTLSELDNIEPEIVSVREELESAQQKLVAERAELRIHKAQREKALREIDASIRSKDERIRGLIQDQKELQKLLDAMEETIANLKIPSDYRPFKALKGKLPWPTKGKPVNHFGRKNSGGVKWQGLLISTPVGSSVKAIHHGRVVFADWFRGKGLLMIIDHGDGYMSLYAHNQSLLREAGDWVKTGDIIATTGNSGGLNESALYFEIRRQGKPEDPSRWCKRT